MFIFLKRGKKVWLLAGIILFLLGGISTGSFSEGTQKDTAYSLQKTLIRATEDVAPAVVNIRVVQLTYDMFFNVVPRKGLGSGVIFRKEGYILTNEHVIHQAKEIKVVLPDGREFKGKLVGSDPSVDLAVVKIRAANLPVAKLGDSNKLKPGEFCVAIGNPFGLQNTVTFGIVSATRRHIQESPEKILENLIQTDAAINPGNSGGPLVDVEGEVIGINTAIIPYAQGIGFAISINTAKEIIDELIKYGKVIRPWLGIYYLPVTPQVKEHFNLPVAKGVYVVKIVSGGPADKAGIKKGDVIVKVNDKPMETAQDFRQTIKRKKVGEKIILSVLRQGKSITIRVKLGEMPTK